MSHRIVTYDEYFLDLSWTWLHDPEIKRLTNSNLTSKEDQLKWFSSLPARKDYLIWGVEYDNRAVGACGIKNITCNDCEYWGYIGEKEYWGKGIGTFMLKEMENKAFQQGHNSIWLKVLLNNSVAISMYKKNGYLVESIHLDEQIMRKKL